jgi:hypothetical protein
MPLSTPSLLVSASKATLVPAQAAYGVWMVAMVVEPVWLAPSLTVSVRLVLFDSVRVPAPVLVRTPVVEVLPLKIPPTPRRSLAQLGWWWVVSAFEAHSGRMAIRKTVLYI